MVTIHQEGNDNDNDEYYRPRIWLIPRSSKDKKI